MAENTGFVSCFLKVVDKASYRKLVADLYFVYEAMEEEIGKLGDHPVVGPVGKKEQTAVSLSSRTSPITSGRTGKTRFSLTLCGCYVERIHAVAKESPELLVGHHYTRYLGDLSGGQILKNIAQKAMNMDGDTACASTSSTRSMMKRPSRPPIAPPWMSCRSIRRWLIASWKRPTMRFT